MAALIFFSIFSRETEIKITPLSFLPLRVKYKSCNSDNSGRRRGRHFPKRRGIFSSFSPLFFGEKFGISFEVKLPFRGVALEIFLFLFYIQIPSSTVTRARAKRVATAKFRRISSGRDRNRGI